MEYSRESDANIITHKYMDSILIEEKIIDSVIAILQAEYPDFTERQIGLRRFSDVLRALEREGLLRLVTDEGGNMLVDIL